MQHTDLRARILHRCMIMRIAVRAERGSQQINLIGKYYTFVYTIFPLYIHTRAAGTRFWYLFVYSIYISVEIIYIPRADECLISI